MATTQFIQDLNATYETLCEDKTIIRPVRVGELEGLPDVCEETSYGTDYTVESPLGDIFIRNKWERCSDYPISLRDREYVQRRSFELGSIIGKRALLVEKKWPLLDVQKFKIFNKGAATPTKPEKGELDLVALLESLKQAINEGENVVIPTAPDNIGAVVPQSWLNFGLDGDTNNKLDQLTEALKSIKDDGIGSKLSIEFGDLVKSYLVLALATSAIIFAHKRRYFLSLLSTIGVLLLKSKEIQEGIMEFIDSFKVEPQANAANFEPLINLTLMALGVRTMVKGNVKDFSTTLSNYGRMSSGASDMFTDAIDIVEKIVNFIRMDIMGLTKFNFLSDKSDEMQDWMDQIDDIEKKVEKKKFVIDIVNYDKVLLLKNLGVRYLKEMTLAGKEYVSLKGVVILYQKKVADILEPFKKASLDASALRSPPLAILLQGESGIGKSALTIPLLDDILLQVIDDPDVLKRYAVNNMDFIYSRNYETKYWDGYRGQLVCVFDDFMQNVENIADADGEPMNLIRAVNPFPYQLHMAHLDDKGNNYFSSKIVLATTNDYSCTSMLIKQPEALKRRFDIVMEVYPKPEYSVDPDKAPRERKLKYLKDFSFDVYEFHVKEDRLNCAPRVFLNYAECVAFITRVYDVKHNNGAKYLNEISTRRQEKILARIEELKGVKPQAFGIQPAYQRELNRIIPKSEQKFFKEEIETLFQSRLCYYDSTMMKRFWNSIYGVGYLVRVHDSPDVLDSIAKKHEFARAFRNYCNFAEVSCTIPVRWDDAYRSRYPVDPQAGESIFDHKCPENMEAFLEGLHDFSEGRMGRIEARELALKMLNNGRECDCGHLQTASEMLMEESTRSRYNVNQLFGKVKSFLNKNKVVPALVGIAGVIATLKAAHCVYKLWGDKIEPQYGEGKAPRTVRALRSYKIAPVIKPQSAENCAVSEKKVKHVDSLVKKNLYICYVDGVEVPWGYMTALGGNKFMINGHYYQLSKWKREQGQSTDVAMVPYVNVLRDNFDVAFHLDLSNIIDEQPPTQEMLDNDIWIFSISNMRPHRNIMNSFISEAELSKYHNRVPILSTFLRSNENENIVALVPAHAQLSRLGVKVDELSIKTVLAAEFDSLPGDCGSVVILNDTDVNLDKIVSIHSAILQDTYTLSTCLTKELMVRLCGKLDACVLPEGIDPDFAYDDNGLLTLPVPHVYHRPTTTKLRKSPFHGVFGESTRDVAVLSASDSADPYEMAIARYGTGNFHVDEKILKYASDAYSRNLCEFAHDKSVLSVEAAISGVSGEPYINGVCRKTSPGYPWNLSGSGGKWHIFGETMDYDLKNEKCVKLIERCEDIVAKAKRGIRCTHYYIDALKDELRSLEKVENCKTRMISCAPLDLVIVMKQYFGNFVSCFVKNRINNGSAVGINPMSMEWSALAKKVLSKGENVIAGDFSSFDATQSSSTLRKLVDIINDWYDDGEENKLVREILWLEVYNSLHIHGEKALMFDHSLPSGNPLTTVINSMYVNVVMRMAFINCFENPAVIEQFDKHVSLIAYGDDNIMGVSDEALELFNYTTIERSLSEFGLIYTNEDKTKIDVKSKTLEECSFLKRAFVNSQGVWVAPLDLSVVSEMWYWYRKGPDARQRIEDNVVNMLRELSIHDEETWNTHIGTVREQTKAHGFNLVSYDQSFYQCSAIASDIESMLQMEDSGIVVQSGEAINSSQMAGEETAADKANDATVFVSDTVVREYELNPYEALNGNLVNAPNVFPQDDVKQFLSRPMQIAQFNFGSTAAAGDTLWQTTVPDGNFWSVVTPLWRQKLAGFLGFRGTAVFRFVVAANRFVQGRMLVHYLPGPSNGDWIKQHNRNLMTRTQQPRIEINMNRDTSAEIRFPYISPSTHYNTTNGEGVWGDIFATVYAPLLGFTGNIEVGVFLHFEDIDLVLPTISLQSGNFREQEKLGPVSRVLDVSQKVAQALGGIPSLKSVTTPAAWFLSYAKKTAMSMGLAVANNADHYLRVGTGANAYSVNNDGQRIAYPMANSNRNEVEILSGFAGSDVDEMNLRYFVSRPAFFYATDLTTSNVTGDVLIAQNTRPGSFFEEVFNGSAAFMSGRGYTMAPVTLLTRLSTYWRGSLVFNFKIVKTEFHTGKLAICFFPGIFTTQLYRASNWTFRHIVDIKDTDEFHVTVPYTSLTPWTLASDSTGILQVFVVNPLNAPPTVSSTVRLLLEVSGGEDFAVSGLSDLQGGPFTQSDFTPQSGLFADDVRIKKFVIGDATVSERQVDAERYCIGEAMTSVRHFTNKFKRCLGGSVAMNNPTIANVRTMTWAPFAVGGFLGTSSPLNIAACSLGGTYIDIFSSCYTLSRGSMYYDLYSTDTTNWIQYSFNSKPQTSRAPFEYGTMTAGLVAIPSNQVLIDGNASVTTGHIVIQTPQWTQGHSRYVRPDNTDGSRALTTFEPNLMIVASNPIATVTFKRSRMYKASGDDFQLGGFVGVPCLYIISTIQNPESYDINA